MIGDYFGGYAAGGRGSFVLDRLSVIANDLDAPVVLPPGGSTLTITEAGPVGIFSSSLVNVQQLQQLLRSGAPLPTATLAGTIADNATMTTTLTISQIQALLASTAQSYDIVPLAAPPASYNAGVNTAFITRNGAGGTTAYDSAGSGAMLQGGVDTLTGGEEFDAFYFYTYSLPVCPEWNRNGPLHARNRADLRGPWNAFGGTASSMRSHARQQHHGWSRPVWRPQR